MKNQCLCDLSSWLIDISNRCRIHTMYMARVLTTRHIGKKSDNRILKLGQHTQIVRDENRRAKRKNNKTK